MSTYEQRHQQLTDAHAAADRLDPDAGDRWRDARRAAALAVLLDAAGHAGTAPPTVSVLRVADELDQLDRGVHLVADLLDQLDPAERRTLLWLAEIGDTAAVAGVAALLDHARS